MRLVRRTTWISRPPEEVFDFFVDFSQASRWRQYVRTMEPIDDGPLRAGSRIHVTMDIGGEAYPFDLDVLAIERPSLWRHRTDEKDFFGYIEYRFEAEQAGTRVTMLVEAKPVGLYGWLGLPLVWLGRNRAYTEQLPRLKQAMEEP
jgi:uncharacterized protein YndB with AHSA1/START domain